MKTCQNCGKQIKEDGKFCPYCGARVEEIPAEGAYTGGESHTDERAYTGGEPYTDERTYTGGESHTDERTYTGGEPRIDERAYTGGRLNPGGGMGGGGAKASGGRSKKPLLLVAAAAIVMIFIVVMLTRPRYTTIVPSEYVKVTCKGLDGKGTANFVFDAESLKSVIVQDQNLKPAQQNELESLLKQAGTYFSLSMDQELTNGEKIAIQSELPTNYLKDYHVKIKNSDYQYTVSGLTDIQTVKLEDYVTLTFTGYEGHGFASFAGKGDQLYADVSEMVRKVDDSADAETFIAGELYGLLYYNNLFASSVDPSEGLSNGDKVTASCQLTVQETGLEKYGIVFEDAAVEKEVEGLEAVETLDITPYIQMDFYGYNSYGTISWSVNGEALIADLTERFPDGRGGYDAEEMADEVKRYISNYMVDGVEPTENLSNGDEVQIRLTGESEKNYISSLGLILENVDTAVVVEGLEPLTEVDLMDIVQVTFSGITPRVSVEVSVDEESPFYQYINWNSIWDIPSSITAYNGDELEVTLDYYEEDALEDGYKIINASKNYMVSGLDTYDFALTDVSEAKLADVIEEQKEQTISLLLKNEDDIWDLVEESNAQILWNQVKAGLDRIVKFYSEEDSYNPNRMALVYKASVPIVKRDEQILLQPVYSILILENVSESAAAISWEDSEINYFYGSEEAVDEALNSMEESVWYDTGCVRTEVVNENLETELTQEAVLPETAVKTETAKSEQPVLTTVEAPEIPESIASKAVASVAVNGHRYYLFDAEVEWTSAVKLCEQKGGVLATVSNREESGALAYLIQQGELEHYWLGGSDEEEGNWTWVTGEPFSFTSWASDQPDNYSDNEDYVVISRSYDNCWNDFRNDKEGVGYILEVAAEGTEETGKYLAGNNMLRHQSEVKYYHWSEDTYGEQHFGVISLDASNNGWLEYELGGGYEWLTGELAVTSEAASGASFDIGIFGDGKLLWSKGGITRQMSASTFAVDVSGVKKLVIATRNLGETDNGWLILDHAKVYQGEAGTAEQEAAQQTSRLSEQYVIDSSGLSEQLLLRRDTTGAFGSEYLVFDTGENAEAAWNLEGNYTELTGKFVTRGGTGGNVEMNVKVYGDDRLLFTEEGIDKTTGQIPFAIDVTGVKVLRIETGNVTDGGDAWLYLTEDLLTGTGLAEDDSAATDASADVNTEPVIELPANVKAIAAGIVEYDTGVYALIENPVTWEMAREFCEQMGGRLAVITSPLEQARVQELLRNASADGYWLGASDEKTEGEWLWTDGTQMTYTNWSGNNPDNYDSDNGGEDYLEIYADGTWNDLGAEDEKGFIFEISTGEKETGRSVQLASLLGDGTWEGDEWEYQERSVDRKGEVHLADCYFDTSDGAWLTGALNGAYETIRGTIVPEADAAQNAKMSIAIFGDGRLLYAKNEIDGWSVATSFEADVTGVQTLMIRTSNTGDSGALLLADAFLDLAQEPSLTGRSAALGDLQLIDSSELEYHGRLFRDSYGNNYDGDWSIDASQDGYGVWLLGGAYTEFSGVLALSKATGSDSSMSVRIYADEVLVFETEELTKFSEPVSFTVDVTGATNLKVETDDVEEAYDGYVYLTADGLR